MSHMSYPRKCIPGRGNSTCKSSELGTCLLEHSAEGHRRGQAGLAWMGGSVVEEEARGLLTVTEPCSTL